jgi:hypothetical protein
MREGGPIRSPFFLGKMSEDALPFPLPDCPGALGRSGRGFESASSREMNFAPGGERKIATIQSRLASRNGLRSGVKDKRCPGPWGSGRSAGTRR